MRHFLTTLLLALLLVQTVASQNDCIIPISFDPKLKTSLKYHRRHREGVVMSRFQNFFDLRGITTDVYNARLAVCLIPIVSEHSCSDGNMRMDIDVQLVDYYTEQVLHSWLLDTFICGEKTKHTSSRYPSRHNKREYYDGSFYSIYDNYFNHSRHRYYRSIYTWFLHDADTLKPVFNKMTEDIRTFAVQLFELNTHNMTRVAQDCAKEGYHETALFALVQYPTCCPSYSNIRDCMTAIYRDYMKKDHKKLIKEAKRVWKDRTSEADARFVISLLNSETLDDWNQWKADRLLRKVGKEYTSLDLKAKEDYTFVPELKAIVIERARTIGVDRSYYENRPDFENFLPDVSPL